MHGVRWTHEPSAQRQIQLWTEAAEDAVAEAVFVEASGDDNAGRFLVAELEEVS